MAMAWLSSCAGCHSMCNTPWLPHERNSQILVGVAPPPQATPASPGGAMAHIHMAHIATAMSWVSADPGRPGGVEAAGSQRGQVRVTVDDVPCGKREEKVGMGGVVPTPAAALGILAWLSRHTLSHARGTRWHRSKDRRRRRELQLTVCLGVGLVGGDDRRPGYRPERLRRGSS